MKITRKTAEQLIAHAKKELPREACGYLAGTNEIITASFVLTNMDQSSEHFSFDPQEQFRVVKEARSRGLEICAVYHSHPNSVAQPSDEDIRLAYDPGMLYVIISLASSQEDIRAFRIKNQIVEPVSVEIIDE